ncbi:MAG: hypothetical protein R2883_01375 [Caldisericia bacterium]
MEKIIKSILALTLVCMLCVSCGGDEIIKITEPMPTNPIQQALSKMPLSIMDLPGRDLKMKAFIFNNIELTAKSRNLANYMLVNENEQISWLFKMGHNVTSSMNSVIDFGKWHHTEFMNQTTWKMNIFDYTRDHEVVFSKSDKDEFLTWMLRHNFEVFKSEPALTLKPGSVYHRDAYVFGAGIVQGEDGATFICRELPTDGTVDDALAIYEGTMGSLLSDPEIYEISSRIPEGAFSSMICKLDTSYAKHNQVTTADSTGFSGVPLTDEQTVWVSVYGRPKELTWFSASHITKDGHHGLLWEFQYDTPEAAEADLTPLTDAIAGAKGRFTEKNWWSEDLYLNAPEITVDGKIITLWSEWIIPIEEKQKIESGEMTEEEKETLWFKYVRSIFDLFDKFERQDYGPLWQGY